MPLSVSLELGDKPKISVKGKNINPLQRDQLSDVLRGEGDLEERVKRIHGGRHFDGFHLGDRDQMPKKLLGTFAKYRWQPATITHEAKKARILQVNAVPVIVGRAIARNRSKDVEGQVAYEITDSVTNSVERVAHWDVSSTLSQEVEYKVGSDAAGGSVGGKTSLSFTAGYGESTGKAEAVTAGALGRGTVMLDPGESVAVEITATRGKIEAQVDYRQTISGGVFYHYSRRVDGHYLYYVPLGKLYSKQELSQLQTELLKIDAFSNFDILFRDLVAGE